jgi:hypothetical protein
LAASAFAIWWLTSLNGLPDIGDPFDVEAFRAWRMPDDQNAFTYLRRANKAVAGRHHRLDRGGAPLPLARARTQPPRRAAALGQLAGARGVPRAAATETGSSGPTLSDQANQRVALPLTFPILLFHFCLSRSSAREGRPLGVHLGKRAKQVPNERRFLISYIIPWSFPIFAGIDDC